MIECTSLITGASSADSRRSTTSSASWGLALLDRVLDRILVAVHPGDQALDVLLEATAGLTSRLGQHRDVVDRQHVGRIGHRQQQRVLIDVGDRDRAVALRHGCGQQVHGRHVDLEHAEVEMIEPIALRDRAGQLLRRDGVCVEQHPFRSHPAGARFLDRLLDALALAEAELDEDVGQEPARTAAAAGW